jgi:hypothetical protein
MFRSFFGKATIAVITIGTLVVIAFSVNTSASASLPADRTPPPALPTNMEAGAPAITPHIHLAASQANLPTFTQTDVVQYISQHGSPAGPLMPGAHLTILKIEFTTARQASQLMEGEDMGIPDNAPVCYVLLQGPFRATNMHLPPASAKKFPGGVPVVSRTELAFDGRTGNLLVWGIPASD